MKLESPKLTNIQHLFRLFQSKKVLKSNLCSWVQADILNNWIVLGVFLISVVNVFISAFGIEPLDGLSPELVRQGMERTLRDNAAEIVG